MKINEEGSRYGLDAKGRGQTYLNYTFSLIGDKYESGALFSFANNPETVTLRVGISFLSTDQACANAESEIGEKSFDEVVNGTKALWNEKLRKIEIDIANTPENVTEMLYTSLYRSFLTPVSGTHSGLHSKLKNMDRTMLRGSRKEYMKGQLRSISTRCTQGTCTAS